MAVSMITPGGAVNQLNFATKTVTFTGASGLGLAGTNTVWFTVTGTVLVVILTPLCTTGLAGATATLTLGVVDATAFFNAATTATDLAANEFWFDATPTEANAFAVSAGFKDIMVLDDDIVSAVATANITSGVVRIDCFWRPLSSNGLIVAA